MKKTIALSLGIAMLSGTAFAAVNMMSSVPSSSMTVTDWYKQDVYDPNNSKIGSIDDVLVGSNGQINAVMIGVGGFLGAGEKDVAVGFDALKQATKNNKMYLTLDTTKDALKSAPGFKYDHDKTTWMRDTSSK